MITTTKTIAVSDCDIILPENTMFFDIETTGFSPASTHLYLIGCCLFENGCWQLTQWFDDTKTKSGEQMLLNAFTKKAQSARHCISFNGQTFDFPYIHKKAMSHQLPDPLAHVEHTDLYRCLKPFKNLLKLPDLKQKSIEAFLGLKRKDTYSGGELITVYDSYIKTKNPDKLSCLLLHNFEDVRGMFDLLPIMAYLEFFKGNFSIIEATRTNNDLVIKLKPNHFITIPVIYSCINFTLELSAYTAQITVHGFDGELKYFYDNYKDYEYLPMEDEAIHKSVAAFVDKKHRQKATRQNCYTKKTDYFLPETDSLFTPIFKYHYHDDRQWFSASSIDDFNKLSDYVHHLLSSYEK